MKKPIVWTIAGSDSGGGAGIQADLHTFHALGVHGCSVITAVTAQNSVGVSDIHYLPTSNIAAQIHMLAQDLPAEAIKLGMLGDASTTENILALLKKTTCPVVLDPVLVSSSGDKLFTENITTRQHYLQSLLPYVQLITPNLHKAEMLTGISIRSYTDMEKAAHNLLSQGAHNVLIKGGHFNGGTLSQDYWTDGKKSFWIASPRQGQTDYHGTGCTLSSAITAGLALGCDIKSAITLGKLYINQGISKAHPQGAGPAPVSHHGWPDSPQSLPWISDTPFTIDPSTQPFPACGSEPLGFYPIVDTSDWVAQLLPLGVKTIQLRIKDKTGLALEQEIKTAIQMAQAHDARLFINDYWQLACEYGAYGVHLGQEDLDTADIQSIRYSGLRLGISTHSYYELARAHALSPSYIALGAIYPTTSKPLAPQGIQQLQRWRALVNYPLVAIGGIDLPQLPAILSARPDGVAVISAITKAPDPAVKAKEFLQIIKKHVSN